MSPQLSRHSGSNRLIVKVRVPQLGALISDVEHARPYAPPAYAPPASQLQNPVNSSAQPLELPPVTLPFTATNI